MNFEIIAGCGSVKYFRDNTYKRLAVAFRNFDWILNNQPNTFNLAEFQLYETFYLSLEASYQSPMLELARERYRQVKSTLAHAGR